LEVSQWCFTRCLEPTPGGLVHLHDAASPACLRAPVLLSFRRLFAKLPTFFFSERGSGSLGGFSGGAFLGPSPPPLLFTFFFRNQFFPSISGPFPNCGSHSFVQSPNLEASFLSLADHPPYSPLTSRRPFHFYLSILDHIPASVRRFPHGHLFPSARSFREFYPRTILVPHWSDPPMPFQVSVASVLFLEGALE